MVFLALFLWIDAWQMGLHLRLNPAAVYTARSSLEVGTKL